MGSLNVPRILAQLKRHEGFRGSIYTDITGHKTVGYGHNLDSHPLKAGDPGYGRDLDKEPLTKDEGHKLLVKDVTHVAREIERHPRLGPIVMALDSVRINVVVNMAFNLGLPRFMKFKIMINNLAVRNYQEAGESMKRSLWYDQVGTRAKELVEQMQTGVWPTEDRG